MGRILWGLLTEAESLVKKCNNLSVLYFILYSFFQHQIKVNFVKVFWSSWFPFDHHCCWQAIFQKLQNYCQILWKPRKEQTGKKTWTNKRIFKQVLQWKAIFLHWFMWSMNKKGGKRTLHGKRIIQYELTLGFLQTLKWNGKFSI